MTLEEVNAALMAAALRYPEAVEEAPWGDRVAKVRKKVFAFVGHVRDGGFGITLKLPESAADALLLENARPAGYGLGRSGWVSVRFDAARPVPLEQALRWLDESYRTVAPKRLVRTLPEHGPPTCLPAAPAPAPLSVGGPVLLCGHDPLRLARARERLLARCVEVPDLAPLTAEALGMVAELRPVAVVVDLSRDAERGMDLLEMLGDGVARTTPVLACGLRDARAEKRAEARLPRGSFSREAPGDPATLDGFLERI